MGGGGGGTSMQAETKSTATSGDVSSDSYNLIDNSMVIGGGGSLTKGAMGTPAAGGTAGQLIPNWALAAGIGLAVVALFRR